MTLAEAYHRERKKGHHAIRAIAIARQRIAEPKFKWGAGHTPYGADVTRDGWLVRIRVDYDQLVSDENRWVERTYELPDRHESVYRNPKGRLVEDEYNYPDGKIWKGFDHRYAYCDPRESVTDLIGHYHGNEGMHKSVAIDTARAEVRREVKRLADDDCPYYLIVVTVFLLGVKLGSDALGGIEIDTDECWTNYPEVQLEEIVNAYEMIDNAIGAAEEKLGALALAKLRDDAQWPFGGKLPTTFSMKNGPATEEEKGAADDR